MSQADAALLNAASLWQISDFVIHEERDVLPEFRFNPLEVQRFVARIAAVRDGNIVCVRSNLCRAIFAIAFPRLRPRIVLVTAVGDWPEPGLHRSRSDDEWILCWFGQDRDHMELGVAATRGPLDTHGDAEAAARPCIVSFHVVAYGQA